MRDADAGNPPAHQSVHALPGDTATLAPAAQHLPPVPDSRIAERLKPFPVAGNRVIVEVALPDRPQPLPRLRNRIVHALPQLLPDFLQFRAHPLAYRLPLHGEAPGCPGPPTHVGESQKIERLRLAFPSPLPVLRPSPTPGPRACRSSGLGLPPPVCRRTAPQMRTRYPGSRA